MGAQEASDRAQADPGVSTPDQRPQRFDRTLVDKFAYARTFTSNTARLDALPRWGIPTIRHAVGTPHSPATHPTKPSTTSVGRTSRTAVGLAKELLGRFSRETCARGHCPVGAMGLRLDF